MIAAAGSRVPTASVPSKSATTSSGRPAAVSPSSAASIAAGDLRDRVGDGLPREAPVTD